MNKNHSKIYAKPPNRGYGYKHRDLALLETWARYIGTKAVLSDVKTAFTCSPALINVENQKIRESLISYVLKPEKYAINITQA